MTRQEFAEKRDDLFNEIENKGDILHSINDVSDYIYSNQAYIRMLVYLDERLKNYFDTKLKELEKDYLEIYKNAKKLPNNYPKFFENIDKITISKNDAFFSKLYKIDDEDIKKHFISLFGNNENSLNFLNKNNINYETVWNVLNVNVFDLMNFLNLKQMRFKIHSGNSYIVRLSEFEKKSIRKSYGFYLFSGTIPKIFESIPRKSRSDKNINEVNKIDLKIATIANLYYK